jgi:hypothetical protein
MVDPHLLAALTFVHAQAAGGSDIEDFVRQSRYGTALPAPDLTGFFAWFGLTVDNGHGSLPDRAGAL